MRIMIFDVPAESGGALTILNQYYNAAIKDTETEWIFVVSTPKMEEHKNIKVLTYPWIKKSWFHRLYFDRLVAPKLVNKYVADQVLSLQNVVVPNIKVKQILYLHQSLPFVEKRFGVFENFKFWIYQNLIGKLIFKSIKEADKVIVQTKWIMDAAQEKAKVKEEKFILKKPELNINVKKSYEQEDPYKKKFFYPASGLEYKNHKVIVEAVSRFKKEAVNFEVVFTLTGNENKVIMDLYETVQKENLPIKFVGKIDTDKVYEYYSKSILIFPSYIETFGLPMLEARIHNSPILASDCAFSHEILDDYDRVEFFDPFDAIKLCSKIEVFLRKY